MNALRLVANLFLAPLRAAEAAPHSAKSHTLAGLRLNHRAAFDELAQREIKR